MATEHEPTIPPPAEAPAGTENFGFTPSPEVVEGVRKATAARALLLDPNKGSEVKVIRPVFALPSVRVVLGDKKSFHVEGYALSGQFRASRLKCNAPEPGQVYMTGLSVANVLLSVGVPWAHKPEREGTLRALLEEPSAAKRGESAPSAHDLVEDMGKHGDPCILLPIMHSKMPDHGCWVDLHRELDVELPTLTPNTRVVLEGTYSGHCPMGYAKGEEFTFTFTFSGHASLV